MLLTGVKFLAIVTTNCDETWLTVYPNKDNRVLPEGFWRNLVHLYSCELLFAVVKLSSFALTDGDIWFKASV